MSEETTRPVEAPPADRSATSPRAPRDVFVSYASQDAPLADAVVSALEAHGLRCWVAPRDVTPGEFYADAIVGAINSTRILIVILTADAVASPHVLREVERASAKRHPVVSLRFDGAPLPAGLEYFLSASHWLDATRIGVEAALPKLVEAAARLLAAPSGADAARALGIGPSERLQSRRRWNRTALMLSVGIALVLGLFVADRLWRAKRTTDGPAATVASPAGPAVAAVPERSVAVLPFVDMSEKKDQEYFADGLSEELIDRLTTISGLRVPARTSSYYFKGKQSTIEEIAKALGVAHVLEGSVRRSGRTLRVTAQLVRVDGGYHIWSATFDRPIGDIFKIQDEIAGAVVQALRVSMLAFALPKDARRPDMEAYTLYLQARWIGEGNGAADFDAAIERLRAALRIDPGFAGAWAALGLSLVWRSMALFSEQPQLCKEAHEASGRAIELDPASSEAHRSMAIVFHRCDEKLAEAEAELKRALEISPGNHAAVQNYAWVALDMHRPEQARQLAERAISMDPLDAWNYEALGGALENLRRLADSEVAYRRAISLNPTAENLHIWLAVLLMGMHQPAAALAEVGREPNQTSRERVLPFVLDALGRTREAEAAIASFESKRATTDPDVMAQFYACRRDADRAIPWLQRAVAQYSVLDLTREPLFVQECFQKIAADPRFKALQPKVKMPG
jgi:TolB-like protein/Flp pilus assembly protein TadD